MSIPGSHWHRWDVHLHTPGTLFEDRFDENWDGYLSALEQAPAAVRVLGITDYFVLDAYKRVLEHRRKGRLKNIELVFPNIEFRVGPMTKDKKALNLHLLVAPDDPNHGERIEHCLSLLTLETDGRPYSCTPRSLIELGRAVRHNQSLPDTAALREGAAQFKVDFSRFKDWYERDRWLRENTLVACSNHAHDGTSGIRDYEPTDPTDGWMVVRDEVLRFCHIIFSANPSDRAYYLGKKPGIDANELARRIGGLRPCLHGSDAHELTRVLTPAQNRYCWIRAEPTFAGLRQVLLEPESRVHIGEIAPESPPPAETIARLNVENAPWLSTAMVPLNPGLNAVIGPRGSGKTALVDIIARAAGASASGDASFLWKAGSLVGDAAARIEFRDGTKGADVALSSNDDWGSEAFPYVRYLSQQFVEDICSSVGTDNDKLLQQIETVIFGAISEDNRAEATSFAELRQLAMGELLQRRQSLVSSIATLTREVEQQRARKEKLPALSAELAQLQMRVKGAEDKQRQIMAPFDGAKRAALDLLTGALETRSKAVAQLQRQQTKAREAVAFIDRVEARLRIDGTELTALLREAGMNDPEKQGVVLRLEPEARSETARIVTSLGERIGVARDTHLLVGNEQIAVAEAERRRKAFSEELGLHTQRQAELKTLEKQLAADRQRISQLEAELKEGISGIDTRIESARSNRRAAYAELLETFRDEEAKLRELYQPLADWLSGRDRVEERSISVRVERIVDVAAWARHGEELFDLRRLRKVGDYGSIEEATNALVASHWQSGNTEAAFTGLVQLLKLLSPAMKEARASGVEIAQIAAWLFSLDHISITYRLQFGDVDLRKLSPGMRGVVLLILFVAIDREDHRPLIIDQPEENLDPKSVHEILVPYFRDVRRRRQVIVVTHNANLVVNTDADNVIIARSERDDPEALPRISYIWGGLENPTIRDAVCDILEGGADAFRARERRYRLPSRA